MYVYSYSMQYTANTVVKITIHSLIWSVHKLKTGNNNKPRGNGYIVTMNSNFTDYG